MQMLCFRKVSLSTTDFTIFIHETPMKEDAADHIKVIWRHLFFSYQKTTAGQVHLLSCPAVAFLIIDQRSSLFVSVIFVFLKKPDHNSDSYQDHNDQDPDNRILYPGRTLGILTGSLSAFRSCCHSWLFCRSRGICWLQSRSNGIGWLWCWSNRIGRFRSRRNRIRRFRSRGNRISRHWSRGAGRLWSRRIGWLWCWGAGWLRSRGTGGLWCRSGGSHR